MSKLFPNLFTPAKIGNLELKNRVCKAPQSSGMNNMDGTVSERAIRYYRDQAAGGTGMIIVVGVCIELNAQIDGLLAGKSFEQVQGGM